MDGWMLITASGTVCSSVTAETCSVKRQIHADLLEKAMKDGDRTVVFKFFLGA